MKTGLSILCAAHRLNDSGYFTPKEIEEKINALPNPTSGYVYAEDVESLIFNY